MGIKFPFKDLLMKGGLLGKMLQVFAFFITLLPPSTFRKVKTYSLSTPSAVEVVTEESCCWTFKFAKGRLKLCFS